MHNVDVYIQYMHIVYIQVSWKLYPVEMFYSNEVIL